MSNSEQELTVETPKKKRGRPKKVDLYRDFQPEAVEVFDSYFESYRDFIEAFYNSTSRIEKAQWERIQQHIKEICERIPQEKFKEYNYKPNSSWGGIDEFREEQRKEWIKKISEHDYDCKTYKGYMIFLHLKYYIMESSKEMKL